MGRQLALQQHHAGAPAEQNGKALAKAITWSSACHDGRTRPGPIQWRQTDGEQLTGFAYAQGQVPC